MLTRPPLLRLVLLLLLGAQFQRSHGLGVLGGGLAAAGFGGFLGWAFQGVGPTPGALTILETLPSATIGDLNALQIGSGSPTVAVYCGAKVRPESYAPLAGEILEALNEAEGQGEAEGSVLLLQSPFNMYCFKPATVAEVLAAYPSVTCVVGHSIGGLWAAEYCRDLQDDGGWPERGLDFFYMGVHGKSLSLEPFKRLPFRKVAWSYASEDVTLRNAAAGDSAGYLERVKGELPAGAAVVAIEGGNHEQYGSYGSPGYAQGLAYEDLPAKISERDQRTAVAAAIAATAARPSAAAAASAASSSSSSSSSSPASSSAAATANGD